MCLMLNRGLPSLLSSDLDCRFKLIQTGVETPQCRLEWRHPNVEHFSFVFGTGSHHIALAWNSKKFSCLSLPSAKIKGMHQARL